jgi:hypothetical protein
LSSGRPIRRGGVFAVLERGKDKASIMHWESIIHAGWYIPVERDCFSEWTFESIYMGTEFVFMKKYQLEI